MNTPLKPIYKPWFASAVIAGIDRDAEFVPTGVIGSPKRGEWFLSDDLAVMATYDFGAHGHLGGLILLEPKNQRTQP